MKRGETSPPKPYTEDGLLEAMQHAGRLIGDADLRAAIDDDSSHSGGLGTPATRASIIEKIIGRGYAERKGRAIVSTPDGEALVDLVDEGLKSPELTARWERALSLVERGEMPLGDFGRPLPDGEVGELVLTTLRKQGAPLIRYRTHDLTRIIPGTRS